MSDDYLSEERFLEACREIYRETRRFRETCGNGGPGADDLASYIAGFWAEVTREAGIGAAFTHEYFADARDGNRDARPEQAADAYRAAGPEGDFRAAAKFFLRWGPGFLPEGVANRLGQIMAGVSERQIPPQLREILDRTPGHLSSDQAFGSFAAISICVAKYMHGLDPTKYRSWLDAHAEILPSDAAGYPSDDRRMEWRREYALPELRDLYEAAGVARRKAGASADIGSDHAPHEETALAWIARAPAENRAVFDRIMREATDREGRGSPTKNAKNPRERRKRN